MATEHTIGQLANAIGINVQTLRYYERLKLLTPMARTSSGYRLYGPSEVTRLRFIKNAQALGFTLHEITELLNLRVSSIARCGDVQRKAQTKLTQVVAKVRDLRALARALRDLIATCQVGQPTDHCLILKALEGERRATVRKEEKGSRSGLSGDNIKRGGVARHRSQAARSAAEQ